MQIYIIWLDVNLETVTIYVSSYLKFFPSHYKLIGTHIQCHTFVVGIH